ncbi:hypothetical protein ACFX2J_034576 [Malus domestica]
MCSGTLSLSLLEWNFSFGLDPRKAYKFWQRSLTFPLPKMCVVPWKLSHLEEINILLLILMMLHERSGCCC